MCCKILSIEQAQIYAVLNKVATFNIYYTVFVGFVHFLYGLYFELQDKWNTIYDGFAVQYGERSDYI